ncbi:MAG: hypothetical protein GY813_08455 [Halieaceae bacterium]|nr:hypothetical protein [Halieaceae bacterium]
MNTASAVSDRGLGSDHPLVFKRVLQKVLGAGADVTLLNSTAQRLQWTDICAHEKTGG